MKHIIFTLFLTVIFFSVNAQIQKGSIITGGHLNFNSNDNDLVSNDYESKSFTISPEMGFFVSESTLLGLGLTYKHHDSKSEAFIYSGGSFTHKSKSNIFYVNPYLTKYYKLKEKFYFTTRANVMAGFGKENDNKVFEIRLNATPGLSYFVSEKWALTCNVGHIYYSHKKVDIDDIDEKEKHKDYGINLNFNTFTIGFQYILGKKN